MIWGGGGDVKGYSHPASYRNSILRLSNSDAYSTTLERYISRNDWYRGLCVRVDLLLLYKRD
jgi:hypothetical protein